MPLEYTDQTELYRDDFTGDLDLWHHEGIGKIAAAPEGGMRLHCFGSFQGGPGCMAFFRPDLPDGIAIEYDIVLRSQGGLLINYLAMRGLKGEDMIADADKLEPRNGIMANYWSEKWGLQSIHVSISRFNDRGEHTRTSNWRRNPGCILAGHGVDPMCDLGRTYRVRLVKDGPHGQLDVDGAFAHAMIDRNVSRYPIPDYGKFGFRLIGSDVMADISRFRVFKVDAHAAIASISDWQNIPEERRKRLLGDFPGGS